MAVMAPGPRTPAHTGRETVFNTLNTSSMTECGELHTGSKNSFTFIFVHGLGVCGVFVVKGEGLLRQVLEGLFGGDIIRWLSGHGVLVVPGG